MFARGAVPLLLAGLTGASALADAATGSAGGDLRWDRRAGRVTAHLTNAPIDKVLARVARGSGWRVFVEPGDRKRVSANFRDLPPSEALHRLLGGLSFALAPGDAEGRRLLVYRSSADAATEWVRAADEGDFIVEAGPIPNELILRIRPGSKITPEELAAKLGAKIVGRLDALGAYLLRFDTAAEASAARTLLAGRDDVASVENNARLSPPEAGSPRDGTTPANTLRPRVVADQRYVVAAIIDTPVQPMSSDYEQFVLERRSVVAGAAAADGTPTHGTVMVESFLQGVSQTDASSEGTRVRVILEDVYGANPTTTTFQVAAGMVDAAARGATIFNFSGGGTDPSPFLGDVIASLHTQGGVVFAASGNDGGKDPIYPAADPWAIGVTALGADGQPAPYANTGPQAVLAAPGTTIVPFQGRLWMAEGTSGATATISGMAAGLASQANLPASQITSKLFQSNAFRPPGP